MQLHLFRCSDTIHQRHTHTHYTVSENVTTSPWHDSDIHEPILIPFSRTVTEKELQRPRRHSTKVNQTLQDVWPSPGLLHYIYVFEGSCSLTEFRPAGKFTLHPFITFSLLSTRWEFFKHGWYLHRKPPQATPTFGRAAITWHFRATSSSNVFCVFAGETVNAAVKWRDAVSGFPVSPDNAEASVR